MNRTNKNTLIGAIIKSYAMAFKFAAKTYILVLSGRESPHEIDKTRN